MSNQPAIIQGKLSPDEIQILEQAGIVPIGTPPAQVAVFGKVCEERGLSAFSKEIYLTGYKDHQSGQMKYSVIVGINGFRKIAAETGQLAGIDDPIFDLQSDGTFKTAAQIKAPLTATVTVWRMVSKTRVPFTHTAVLSEFSTGKQKWATMPFQMIGKVAEAFALRKGFSDRLTGLSVEEEMGAMQGVAIENIKRSPEAKEAPIPEKFHAEFEQACDILNAYTDIVEVADYWYSQADESPAKMFVTFAKAFFDAAARVAKSREDMDLFWKATPTKWKQSERLVKILSTRQSEIDNGKAA